MPVRGELDSGEDFLVRDLTAVKERAARDGCVCVCKDVGKRDTQRERERERLKK